MLSRVVCSICTLIGLVQSQLSQQDTVFDWNSITPSRDLEYHPCYGNETQCARLIAPLDYKNLADPRTVALAILKVPALVPRSHPKFGGSVFINPGGPGDSATQFARFVGPQFQARLERSGRRHYEWIGIDPRGVGHSSPPANCFPDDLFSRQLYDAEYRGVGPLSQGLPDTPLSIESLDTMPHALGLVRGFNQRCFDADSSKANGGPIIAYAGTASVARDMVEVADKIAQLQAKQRKSDTSVSTANATRSSDVARVQFIGFSYGTVIAHYFASLFPERVGRLVLDGVVDAYEFSKGRGWDKALVDADEIWHNFFRGCWEAGPDICALARRKDRSPSDIQGRVAAWLSKLHKLPMTSIGPTGDVRVMTAYDVRTYIGLAVYSPVKTFKTMASHFDKAINGNASALMTEYFSAITPPHTKKGCLDDTPARSLGVDGAYPVVCGDSEDVSSQDLGYWESFVISVSQSSFVLGNYWAKVRFNCAGWRFTLNWRFNGPFTSPPSARRDVPGQSVPEPVPGAPAAPLLYLSNRLDPATPLASARKMKQGYPGAGLIIADGMGHLAAAGASTSRCLDDLVEAYLETGVVPKKDVVCKPDCGPWNDTCQVVGASGQASTETGARGLLANWSPLGVSWA